MGILYDVTYPKSRDLDREVSFAYLQRLARDPRMAGAKARPVNGMADRLVLVRHEDGTLEWVPEK